MVALLGLSALLLALHALVSRSPRPSAAWPRAFAAVVALVRWAQTLCGALLARNELAAGALRALSAVFGSLVGCVEAWRLGVSIEGFQHGGREHLWLKPKNFGDGEEQRLVVLFYHGGGFTTLSPRMFLPFACQLRARVQHKMDELPGRRFRVEVLLANYRKAPKHRYPAAAQDAVDMYEFLLDVEKQPASHIVLAGDSAGAGLVVSTLLRLKKLKSRSMPRAALLLCPFVDMMEDEQTQKLSDRECDRRAPFCMLSTSFVRGCAKAYMGDAYGQDGECDASSVHCDLSGLPPAIVQVGSLDHLLPQGRKLAERGPREWILDEHALMPHDFMIFPLAILPHAAVAQQRLARFVAAQFQQESNGNQD